MKQILWEADVHIIALRELLNQKLDNSLRDTITYCEKELAQAKIDFADDEDFLNSAIADINTVLRAAFKRNSLLKIFEERVELILKEQK